MTAFLFGGSTLAKITLFLLVALGAGGALLAAKAIYDRNRRREGAREVMDQIQKETDDARKRSDDEAGRYRRDGGAGERLRRNEY